MKSHGQKDFEKSLSVVCRGGGSSAMRTGLETEENPVLPASPRASTISKARTGARETETEEFSLCLQLKG